MTTNTETRQRSRISREPFIRALRILSGPVRVVRDLCNPRLIFHVLMALILESPPSCGILPSKLLRRISLVKTVSSNSMKTKSNNKKSGSRRKTYQRKISKKVRPKSLSRTAIRFRDKITFHELKVSFGLVILYFLSRMCASFTES